MAFYSSTDALYGIGVYGSARYGVVEPVVTLTGVSAVANTRTLHLDVFEIDVTEPIYNAPSATGSVGSLTLDTTAGITSVGLTGTINSVGVGVSVPLAVSVEGVVSTNTVKENVTLKPDGLGATFTINDAGLNIKSINRVPVTGVPLVGAIGTPEPIPTESLLSVSATGYVNGVTVNVTENVVTTTALSGSINGAVTFSNTHNTQSVLANFTVGILSLSVDEPLTTTPSLTVSASPVKANPTEKLNSTSAVGQAGSVTTTAEVFDFQAVKNEYSRKRTVILPRAA
jgi:hypothetical protein